MDRMSAWIDAKPYRFQLILLGHTAVFACAVLIAAGLFRTPPATPACGGRTRLGRAAGDTPEITS